MIVPTRQRRHRALLLPLTLLVALLTVALPSTPLGAAIGGPTAAQAATPITVATARTTQNGSTATVRGYVVGQPTASATVVRSGFPSDYALALADTPTQTDTTTMIYVQVPSASRAAWGLRTNPGLLGTQIDVTGSLSAYFARPGVTSASAFALVGTGDGGGTPGGGTGGSTEHDAMYYASALGLSGPQLEAELHEIISTGTRTVSYATVWTALQVTDQDPASSANVLTLYGGFSMSKTNNGGGVDQWNREHVWPQSHGGFGTAAGPGTDLHHLRPTDVTVNSARGNLDFDEGGTQNTEAPGNFADSNSWEPRDAVKGDVARMILYMSVRYEGGDGWPDLEVNDAVSNGSAPNVGRLSVLLDWNAQDPPDAFEKRRNDIIFETYQGNRNPFVDHPEWADAIW
ncbi:endonuclease [Sanguibacter antarcticus]|uniref:Endonuclease I n=1 Tax=Sanguibacter antarcticus TaxID=372484 RepID=A0A2A9E9S0_9MICO|nr:endonuclease [Sanguibacter antarcticus]PFG34992.1 endonuclease I [Sanguibacter antarcticus]